MSECGPDCDCPDGRKMRANAERIAREFGSLTTPTAAHMNESVKHYPSDSEPFTIESGPFRGRIYRVNSAGQRVRQKHLERSARL